MLTIALYKDSWTLLPRQQVFGSSSEVLELAKGPSVGVSWPLVTIVTFQLVTCFAKSGNPARPSQN
jgi:hypothetical protein